MLQSGSLATLRTQDAIYSPCRIVDISDESVTISYFAGSKKNPKTNEVHEQRLVETIPWRKIVSLVEML
jgi:hypothetical protein